VAKRSPDQVKRNVGWGAYTIIEREFDKSVRVSDAVLETIMKAVEDWPELDQSPPVYEFVAVDKLDGLFETRAAGDTSRIPSVEFPFQDAHVTVLYGSTVRVIVDRDS
jgi:hypothetical protein